MAIHDWHIMGHGTKEAFSEKKISCFHLKRIYSTPPPSATRTISKKFSFSPAFFSNGEKGVDMFCL
jgi:hypothetical protein